MGITYLYSVDGTNIKEIRKVLAEAKRVRIRCWFMYARSRERDIFLPSVIRRASMERLFDIDTGVPLYHQEKAHYTDVFSTVMRKMGSGSRRWLRLPQRWQTEPV